MTDETMTDQDGYECEHCDQVFKTPQGLGAHRLSAHGIRGTSTSEGGYNLETCELCGKRVGHINAHKRRMHGIFRGRRKKMTTIGVSGRPNPPRDIPPDIIQRAREYEVLNAATHDLPTSAQRKAREAFAEYQRPDEQEWVEQREQREQHDELRQVHSSEFVLRLDANGDIWVKIQPEDVVDVLRSFRA